MDFMDTRTKHAIWVVVALCAVTAFIVIVSASAAYGGAAGREPVEEVMARAGGRRRDASRG